METVSNILYLQVISVSGEHRPLEEKASSEQLRGSNPELQSKQHKHVELLHIFAVFFLNPHVNICLVSPPQVPWPVDIVISSECQKIYNQVFLLLLQIKWAKYSLDALRFSGKT